MAKVNLCYIFSGSGTKFPVFIGALRAIEEHYAEQGIETEIVHLIGTSGGAITAAGIASGYTTSEEMELFCRKLMPELVKTLKPSIWTFIKSFGFLKTDGVLKALTKHLPKTTGETDIPVELVTANIDANKASKALSIYSTLETPKTSLPLAVLASMSIPFVFPAVMINGRRHVDGGWLKNFAVDEVDGNCKAIGFYFGLEAPAKKKVPLWRPFSRLFNYIGSLVDLTITQNMIEALNDVKGNVDIYELKTEAGGLDLDITQDDITKMINNGYRSVKEQLNESL